MVAVTNLPLGRVKRVAALEIHFNDVAIAQFETAALPIEALREFAAGTQIVRNRDDVIIESALQEFEIVLGCGIAGLTDIGQITNSPNAAQNANNDNDDKQFDERKAVFAQRWSPDMRQDFSRN